MERQGHRESWVSRVLAAAVDSYSHTNTPVYLRQMMTVTVAGRQHLAVDKGISPFMDGRLIYNESLVLKPRGKILTPSQQYRLMSTP